MLARAKKRFGFKEKPKTREEIQKQYAETAMEVGHKCRLLKQKQTVVDQLNAELSALNAEIDIATEQLVALNVAGMSLPVPASEPETTTETTGNA